jgi:hypothetical protein
VARIMGSKAVLFLDDQAGTCRNISGDLNNIGFNRSVNLPETTTFGDNAVQREITGLMDAGLDCTAIWNTGAIPLITDMLENLYAASAHTRMQFAPAGSTTGSPLYTACVRMTTLNVTTPVDNLVTATFNLVLASGSVIAACVAS